jgi:hypothetical protein
MCVQEMFRSTTKAFIEKAIKTYGDKYNYSKVNYINSKTKVIIICPLHGEFEQQPNNHLQGYGCKHCSLQKLWVSSNNSSKDGMTKKRRVERTTRQKAPSRAG